MLSILEYTVQDQNIGAFYDRRALQRIAGEVSRSSALNALAVSWSLPRELAADLVKLALFDIVILVDDRSVRLDCSCTQTFLLIP